MGRMGVSSHVLALLDNEDSTERFSIEPQNWIGTVSRTELMRLHLCRALVIDPECFVVHTPTLPFPNSESRTLMSLFREFIDKRGLGYPDATMGLCRLRTVFFTAASQVA